MSPSPGSGATALRSKDFRSDPRCPCLQRRSLLRLWQVERVHRSPTLRHQPLSEGGNLSLSTRWCLQAGRTRNLPRALPGLDAVITSGLFSWCTRLRFRHIPTAGWAQTYPYPLSCKAWLPQAVVISHAIGLNTGAPWGFSACSCLSEGTPGLV